VLSIYHYLKNNIYSIACPDGWETSPSGCLKVFGTGSQLDRKNWRDARAHCKEFEGGDLATIPNSERQLNIQALPEVTMRQLP